MVKFNNIKYTHYVLNSKGKNGMQENDYYQMLFRIGYKYQKLKACWGAGF
jgi:hypothetical protein